MFAADAPAPVSAAEAARLFAPLREAVGLVLAVSGGPDSTALLWLAARWRRSLKQGPALLAVTIDHGLRPEAHVEAEAVKRLAKQCGVAHRIVRWTGPRPESGLQRSAREARYRLLAAAARKFAADRILTGHTCDDQAETLLLRMSCGSGITGLCAMAQVAPLPGTGSSEISLVRPLLGLSKARLIATIVDAGLTFADDPSNRDLRFTRSRLRALMPILAREGLDPARLSRLARRLQRAEDAIRSATHNAWPNVAREQTGAVAFDPAFAALPAEIQLRLLGRAIACLGDEGPVELGKLEALHASLCPPHGKRMRRTLAGAMVTREDGRLTVEKAPARRPKNPRETLNHRATPLPQSRETALE